MKGWGRLVPKIVLQNVRIWGRAVPTPPHGGLHELALLLAFSSTPKTCFVRHLRLVTRPLLESNHRVPDWIAVILLGIIEGVTEFLPVSSTGHLLLAERWLPEQTDLLNTVIQCGAVLAVLLVFSARVRHLLSTWREPASRDYLLKLTAAFLLTATGGLLVKKLGWKLPHEAAPVAWATRSWARRSAERPSNSSSAIAAAISR